MLTATTPAKSRRRSRKAASAALAAAGTLIAATTAAGLVGASTAAATPLSHGNTAVTRSDETPPSGSISLSETGSSLLYPLFELWAASYHKQYSNVSITPESTGSGTGISDAESATVNIGASDAYLSPTDLAQYPGLKNIALAISAQMINYNIPGLSTSTHLKLDGGVLASIYEGHITNWDDSHIASLNPGVKLPNLKIVALHRSDSSGDTFLFSTYLSDANPDGWGKTISYGTSISFPSISNALAEDGNGGMVKGCGSTPGCIAYIGISYLQKTDAAHLGEAALQNRDGFFHLPNPTTVTDEAAVAYDQTPPDEALSLEYDGAAGGYPIINYEYAIIPPKEASSTDAKAVKAFLYWAIDTSGGSAPSFLNQVNFEPLPASIAKLSAAQIAQIS